MTVFLFCFFFCINVRVHVHALKNSFVVFSSSYLVVMNKISSYRILYELL